VSDVSTARNAPAKRPAELVCPPSRNRARSAEASGIIARIVLACVAFFLKKFSGTSISASSIENRRKPSLTMSASSRANVARVSKMEVLCGKSVFMFPAFSARTSSCTGTVVSPACNCRDCSGDKDQSSPNRAERYCAQNPQNDAYQAVPSPAISSGCDVMYQPFITTLIHPDIRSRSRWVRVKSLDRTAVTPFDCRTRKSSRDYANFSAAIAMLQSLARSTVRV